MLMTYDTSQLPSVRLIGRIRYREAWQHFSRTVDEFVLYVLREGDMYIEEDGVQMHLKAGDCLLLEPNLPHRGYRAAACDYYYVHFSHAGLLRAAKSEAALENAIENRRRSLLCYNLDTEDRTDPVICLPKLHGLIHPEHRRILHSAAEIYDQREEQYKRFAATELHRFFMLAAHDYLDTALAGSGGRRRKSETAVEALLRYLNGNYTKDLSGAWIEERFEMNFDHLNRVFAETTGSTIFQYLNRLRVHNAKQLIATTNLPFSEIAYLVGINDRYYFSRLFKRMTGTTPTEYYRKSHGDTAKAEVRHG